MTRPLPRATSATRAARGLLVALVVACFALCASLPLRAQSASGNAQLPELTQPVNDFANVIDAASRAEIDRICRALLAATTDKNGVGDTVIVVTTQTVAPYADIREYAVKLFENHGRGIGDKQKDNGLLVVLAIDERQQWNEVGYGLEGFITDGFAGETSRQYMAPYFKNGRYGEGLKAGVTRFVARIAKERGVTLENVRAPEPQRRERRTSSNIGLYIFLAFVLISLLSGGFGGGGGSSTMRRRRRPGGWSDWSGGVGPFGGSWGGGFGGGGGGGFGGGGGGFGGFGGGSSGGGGGGSSW